MPINIQSQNQLNRIANIMDNAEQVFLGKAVLPYIILRNFPTTFIMGIIATAILWVMSLKLEGITQ